MPSMRSASLVKHDQTAWYPVMKRYLVRLGFMLQKELSRKLPPRSYPLSSGVISGGSAYASFCLARARLRRHLRLLPMSVLPPMFPMRVETVFRSFS